MKRILATTIAVSVLAWAGGVSATPVTFDVDGAPDSYVHITDSDTWGNTSISATLADLDSVANFTLDDGESEVFEFFTLSVTGNGVGSFAVESNLNFDDPDICAFSYGNGNWMTYSGWGATFSAGQLAWDNVVQTFNLTDGNTVQIALEDGCALGAGSSTTIHATVTHLGPSPVPEPSTLLIVGSGLIGLVGYNRKRFNLKGQLMF
ncbi:MAG: PEP-CTERM sorting domain-containing protein [Thermodesulfobacteriota bacterium]|nr:PEP-CTERM sorting domain-containing protein [Thermodesulfobacteriota bacterium]